VTSQRASLTSGRLIRPTPPTPSSPRVSAFDPATFPHVRYWPGDRQRLVINRSARRPQTFDLGQLLDQAHHHGFVEVLTGAVDGLEAERYLDAGFTVRSTLVVLERWTGPNRPVATPTATWLGTTTGASSSTATHRAPRWLRPQLADIDQRAFGDFWHLDSGAIAAAQQATARSITRFVHDQRTPVGYALWGLGGDVGYLQRLAVVPEASGQGIGSALVRDGLRRLDRRTARILVNTEIDNHRARQLYERHGFVLTSWQLRVLGYAINAPAPTARYV
jgi:ribosomal protein S18 acetylase RimI-like enzyme